MLNTLLIVGLPLFLPLTSLERCERHLCALQERATRPA
jgi:hypothetical protein